MSSANRNSMSPSSKSRLQRFFFGHDKGESTSVSQQQQQQGAGTGPDTETGVSKETGDTTAPQLRDPFSPSDTQRSMSADSGDSTGLTKSESAPHSSLAPGQYPQSPSSPSHEERQMSKEWDASKVPPSRFQKRAGSIFSTGSSRDSHITRRDRDSTYHDKLKEKGWA